MDGPLWTPCGHKLKGQAVLLEKINKSTYNTVHLSIDKPTSDPYVCTTWQSMRKEMSKSRARTDADLAKGNKKNNNVSVVLKKHINERKFPIRNKALTSFTADVLGKLIKPGTNRRGKHLHNT